MRPAIGQSLGIEALTHLAAKVAACFLPRPSVMEARIATARSKHPPRFPCSSGLRSAGQPGARTAGTRLAGWCREHRQSPSSYDRPRAPGRRPAASPRLADGGQVPCCCQGRKRGAAADAGDRIGEPIHSVKILMTICWCQFILDIRTVRGIPPASRRIFRHVAPTVPPPPALSFLVG